MAFKYFPRTEDLGIDNAHYSKIHAIKVMKHTIFIENVLFPRRRNGPISYELIDLHKVCVDF